MMVVTVAGILVTLAEPSFHQSVVKAKEAALKQNLFTLRDVIDQYRADRGQYPPALEDLKTAGYLKRVPIDPITKSTETWQFIQDTQDGGIFDVHSGSDLLGTDGTAYNEW
jgi:general secretion pathway protein G